MVTKYWSAGRTVAGWQVMGCLAVEGWHGTAPGGRSEVVSSGIVLNADVPAMAVLTAVVLDSVLARVVLAWIALTGVLVRIVLAEAAFAFAKGGLAGGFLVADVWVGVLATAP